MKKAQFKKTLMASVITSVSIAGMSVPAFAQDVEEVLVTGVRASLERAADVKRNSPGVVDAISSEDIGKMPDTNLAESLQRITGLSINRTDGEGSRVTARGIGAELNMVTLNGRVMPAVDSGGNTGDAATRAYDFANLASESVSGIEVFKTGRADVATGGLGATVNIKTLRPLEAGTRATVAAKAINDSTARSGVGSEYTPEISGMGSWVNDEGTFGVALIGSYQERDSSNANNFVNRWDTHRWLANNIMEPTDSTKIKTKRTIDTFHAGAVVNGTPEDGALYSLPTDLRYEVQDNERARKNAQLVVQFKPVEELTATLDYTYSGLDRDSERRQQSVWFNTNAISKLDFDGGVVATPLIYEETYGGFKDMSFAAGRINAETDNNSIGLNLEYEANDQLTLGLDYHNSTAYNVAQGLEIGLNANVVTGNQIDWSYEMPLMGVTINDGLIRDRLAETLNPDGTNVLDADGEKTYHKTHHSYQNGNGNNIIDGGDVSGAMSNNLRSVTETEIEQIRLYGDFKFEGSGFFENAGVKFGFEQREDTNFARASGDNRQGVGNWDGVDPKFFPDQYFTSRDFGDDFPDYGSTTGNSAFRTGLEADLSKIVEVAEYLFASKDTAGVSTVDGVTLPTYKNDFYDFVNGKVQWNGVYTTNRFVVEESKSFYGQFYNNFELFSRNSNLMLGLRYEETDVTASSDVNEPLYLWWEGDNDWSTQFSSIVTNTAVGSDYDYLLPSLDFDIEVVEDVILRASFSQTIGRPAYGDMRPNLTLDNLYNRTANQGNPGIKPMESTNFDISAEWYYSEGSYASIGYFSKEVEGFIGSSTYKGQAYNLKDARLGAYAIASGISQSDEQALYEHVLGRSSAEYIRNAKHVRANENDPLIEWTISTPVNDKDATIDGLEFAVQHWFGDTGFGIQANYTAVDADVSFDNTSLDGQFAMTGLSDTANFAGFYDRDDWQIRIAYNWRDEFLLSRTHGGTNSPQYVEAFDQIDVSVGYEINENLSISFEGINVTGENYRTHGRTSAQLLSLEDLGARYQLGMRYTF